MAAAASVIDAMPRQPVRRPADRVAGRLQPRRDQRIAGPVVVIGLRVDHRDLRRIDAVHQAVRQRRSAGPGADDDDSRAG